MKHRKKKEKERKGKRILGTSKLQDSKRLESCGLMRCISSFTQISKRVPSQK